MAEAPSKLARAVLVDNLRLKKGDSTHGDPAQRAKDVEDLAYASEPTPKTLDVRSARFKLALAR